MSKIYASCAQYILEKMAAKNISSEKCRLLARKMEYVTKNRIRELRNFAEEISSEDGKFVVILFETPCGKHLGILENDRIFTISPTTGKEIVLREVPNILFVWKIKEK